jgi:hypothetical protein
MRFLICDVDRKCSVRLDIMYERWNLEFADPESMFRHPSRTNLFGNFEIIRPINPQR